MSDLRRLLAVLVHLYPRPAYIAHRHIEPARTLCIRNEPELRCNFGALQKTPCNELSFRPVFDKEDHEPHHEQVQQED